MVNQGGTYLADGNVLIALGVREHIHHRAATDWFSKTSPQLATCPITQGTLLRYLLRGSVSPDAAMAVLGSITEQPWHAFWPDDLEYRPTTVRGVIGHRQLTDAYLADLAAAHQARVATLDRGLAALRPDDTELIPT